MTNQDIERLRSCTDRVITMKTSDGETLIVKVLLMQDEYQDFIHEIIASDREHKYRKPLNSAAYTTHYDEVIFFALAEEGN